MSPGKRERLGARRACQPPYHIPTSGLGFTVEIARQSEYRPELQALRPPSRVPARKPPTTRKRREAGSGGYRLRRRGRCYLCRQARGNGIGVDTSRVREPTQREPALCEDLGPASGGASPRMARPTRLARTELTGDCLTETSAKPGLAQGASWPAVSRRRYSKRRGLGMSSTSTAPNPSRGRSTKNTSIVMSGSTWAWERNASTLRRVSCSIMSL
jgi:hypothetical protein